MRISLDLALRFAGVYTLDERADRRSRWVAEACRHEFVGGGKLVLLVARDLLRHGLEAAGNRYVELRENPFLFWVIGDKARKCVLLRARVRSVALVLPVFSAVAAQ